MDALKIRLYYQSCSLDFGPIAVIIHKIFGIFCACSNVDFEAITFDDENFWDFCRFMGLKTQPIVATSDGVLLCGYEALCFCRAFQADFSQDFEDFASSSSECFDEDDEDFLAEILPFRAVSVVCDG